MTDPIEGQYWNFVVQDIDEVLEHLREIAESCDANSTVQESLAQIIAKLSLTFDLIEGRARMVQEEAA